MYSNDPEFGESLSVEKNGASEVLANREAVLKTALYALERAVENMPEQPATNNVVGMVQRQYPEGYPEVA